MKSIVILILFTFGLACNNTKEVTNKTTSKETIGQPMSTSSGQQLGIPGRITFKAKVLEIYEGKQMICGISKQNVVQVEVLEVLNSGSGIAKMPTPKEKILVSFLLPSQDLVSEAVIEAKAKESLCPSTSQTYFTINSHKILE